MSQPNSNHPHFQYTVHRAPDQNFGAHVSQSNNHNWQTRLHSGRHNISSPSASVRSVITEPSRRSFDLTNGQQSSVSPIDAHLDPSLFLTPLSSSGHVPQTAYENLGQTYHGDESWGPFNLRTVGGDQARLDPVHSSFKGYRTGPGSVGSAAPISDSGFYSQSVLSNEPGRFNQELPPSITSQVDNMRVSPSPCKASEQRHVSSDQISRASSRSGRQDKQIQCQECPELLKCKSDFKKHMLKHHKPFRCEESGCKRQQGFTTVNDLDRHKKSVHRVGLLKKSYQCASETCRNKEKIWPRLDNFKQHIERMHKGEDHIELIRKSTYVPQKIPQTINENEGVAPMETMLAGILGHERYDLGAPAAIPDQDIGQWSPVMPMEDLQMQERRPSSSMPQLDSGSGPMLSRLTPGHSKICKLDRPRVSAQRDLYEDTKASSLNNARQTMNPQLGGFTARPIGRSQPKVSTGPQTKVQQQQQRQALQKPPKAAKVGESISPRGSVDLKQSILRILSSATSAGDGSGQSQSHMDTSCLSESNAIRAVQAITNLIQQSSGSAYSQPRRPQVGATSGPKVCPKCHYAVARACDLKKHMIRHEKPYGCTYPKCYKRFGAKSDWKRHENSQHFQLEAYRCRKLDSENKICGKHYFRAVQFEAHLEARHGISSKDERERESKERKIGKNCQGKFWCGFCVDIKTLNTRKNAAWDERFDHIASHFQKGEKIDDWVCAEENKTKQELLRELDRDAFDDDDEREVDAPDETDGLPMPSGSQSPMNLAPPPAHFIPEPTLNDNGKRMSSSDNQGSSNKRMSMRRYCCGCHEPFPNVSAMCVGCYHEICATCWTE